MKGYSRSPYDEQARSGVMGIALDMVTDPRSESDRKSLGSPLCGALEESLSERFHLRACSLLAALTLSPSSLLLSALS